MIKIFDIIDGKLVLNSYNLSIPIFRRIYERDNSKGKEVSYNEISYIFHLVDIMSPYFNYLEAEREGILRSDYERSGYIIDYEDSLLIEGIEEYRKLTDSSDMKLLRSVKGVLEQLSVYFDAVDFNLVDKSGKQVYEPKVVLGIIEKIDKSRESMYLLEQNILRNRSNEESRIRGGGKVGYFEDNDSFGEGGVL